jgi:hypothetical protein
MIVKRFLAATFLPVLILLFVVPSLAQTRREPVGGTQSATAPDQRVSPFQTLNGVFVRADAEEGVVYFTEANTENKFQVLVDESTKFKIEKKKGGLEMLEALTEGMAVEVTVDSRTGVARLVKVKKPKNKG